LEQYPTSAHLSACVIQLATDNGDLGPEMSCLDLGEHNSPIESRRTSWMYYLCLRNGDFLLSGCGTGMLSVAAAFVSGVVFAIDCDSDALDVARENAEQVELEDTIHFVKAKVKTGKTSSSVAKNKPPSRKGGGRHGQRRGGGRGSQPGNETKAMLILDDKDGIPMRSRCVDTVLTNPPFGTKHNAGIDVQFLRTATRLATRAVYSFHKRSTRAFLTKTVEEWGYEVQVAAEMEFDIPQMYKFHNKKSKDVEVDLLRIVISGVEGDEELQQAPDEAANDDADE
jgi:predicted RNA methylase